MCGICPRALTDLLKVRSFALVLIRRLAFQRPDQSNPTQELWADLLRLETRQNIVRLLLLVRVNAYDASTVCVTYQSIGK